MSQSNIGSRATAGANDVGLGALFDFKFDYYLTLRICRLAYKVVFLLALLNAVVSVAIAGFVAFEFAPPEYRVPLVGLSFVMSGVVFFGILIIARLWLEALVVHFKGHEGALHRSEIEAAIKSSASGATQASHATPPSSRASTPVSHTQQSKSVAGDGDFHGVVGSAEFVTWLQKLQEHLQQMGASTRVKHFALSALAYGFLNKQTPEEFVKHGYNKSADTADIPGFRLG